MHKAEYNKDKGNIILKKKERKHSFLEFEKLLF